MDEVGSLALILDLGPCKAGKKLEWRSAGFLNPSRGATSLVILKYGSYGPGYVGGVRDMWVG